MFEHLRGLREDKDLSQKAMAEYLNIHQTTYSEYELNKTNIPIPILIKLAMLYDTSVDYIIGITNERKPYPRNQ